MGRRLSCGDVTVSVVFAGVVIHNSAGPKIRQIHAEFGPDRIWDHDTGLLRSKTLANMPVFRSSLHLPLRCRNFAFDNDCSFLSMGPKLCLGECSFKYTVMTCIATCHFVKLWVFTTLAFGRNSVLRRKRWP